jgi:Ca2+-transporting ATPase
MEPAEKNTMQQKTRQPQESLFSGGLAQHVVWVGLVIGVVALAVAAVFYDGVPAKSRWQTMVFMSLSFLQMGQAMASRSTTQSLLSLGLGSNPILLGLVVITAVFQVAILYIPFLNNFFELVPLSLVDLLFCIALGFGMLLLIEAEKLWARRRGAS